MKVPLATAVHVITVVTIATTLAVAHGSLSVYLLDNVDPKFGAAGTVQLLALIAVLCSGVAAIGSGLFHYFWLQKHSGSRRALSLLSGAIVGSLLAIIHKPFLFNMPVAPGISDWQQQCLYFLVLGFVLHWLSALVMNAFSADRSKTGVDWV